MILLFFSDLADLVYANENNQYWQISPSFPDSRNQNGGIQIGKREAKIIHAAARAVPLKNI